jgi:hypothetical protein
MAGEGVTANAGASHNGSDKTNAHVSCHCRLNDVRVALNCLNTLDSNQLTNQNFLKSFI